MTGPTVISSNGLLGIPALYRHALQESFLLTGTRGQSTKDLLRLAVNHDRGAVDLSQEGVPLGLVQTDNVEAAAKVVPPLARIGEKLAQFQPVSCHSLPVSHTDRDVNKRRVGRGVRELLPIAVGSIGIGSIGSFTYTGAGHQWGKVTANGWTRNLEHLPIHFENFCGGRKHG